jgi:hypothetical protein
MSDMNISAGQAEQIARAYVATEQTWARFAGLMEDRADYLICTEPLIEGAIPVGPGWAFISKRTGEVWEAHVGSVFDGADIFTRLEGMTPVRGTV